MNGGKRKLSEEYEKKVIGLLETIANQTQPPKEESSKPTEGHKSLAEKMLCPSCNPPEEYVKAHLKLMGQKKCEKCGNIDKEAEESCTNCYEDY